MLSKGDKVYSIIFNTITKETTSEVGEVCDINSFGHNTSLCPLNPIIGNRYWVICNKDQIPNNYFYSITKIYEFNLLDENEYINLLKQLIESGTFDRSKYIIEQL